MKAEIRIPGQKAVEMPLNGAGMVPLAVEQIFASFNMAGKAEDAEEPARPDYVEVGTARGYAIRYFNPT